MSVVDALVNGPRTSKEIQALTGLSQASVSRTVRTDKSIVRMPGAAPYRYAASKTAFGAGSELPVCTIDAYGKTVPRAVLVPLRPSGYLSMMLAGTSVLLAGVSGDGHFEALPYYLDDARPQGFLGKIIAEQLANQSDEFTPNPDSWTEQQVGRYLISNGDNLPSDFVFGYPMKNRLRAATFPQSRSDYSQLALNIMEGLAGGSSAGGKQPKFTAFITDIASHIIVKFTPSQDDLTASRWRDILVTEFHALTVLSEFGFPAADTKLYDQAGRYFLESKRFDRRGAFGRSSMFSMRTIDAEFAGVGGSWTDVADALHNDKLISYFDLQKIKELETFGRLINNTDMHLGNLSLAVDGDQFSLLPAYDMCSMGFAPKGTEVGDLQFNALETFEETRPITADVLNAAIAFWNRVVKDNRTSAELKSFILAKRPASVIEKLR